MPEILSDLSEPALRTAIASNFYALFELLGQAPSVEFHRQPELLRWRTAVMHPLFQGVLVRSAASGEEARLIRESREYFDGQGVTVFSWWFSPGVDPTPWEGSLRDQGFMPDDDPPGMAVVLDELLDEQPPSGLRIVRVASLDALREWSATFGVGYELPPPMASHFAEMMRGIGLDGALQHYLGYRDDIPLATSSLWLAAGVAGIYNVATIPAARGQSIGSAITVAPLREARALGYRAAILQASEMGFRAYQRLGFRHLCAMDHYFWAKRSS